MLRRSRRSRRGTTSSDRGYPPADAAPSPARSHRQLAAHLEVHEVTRSDWKQLAGWHDAVAALAFEHVKGDLVPVLHAQVARAKKGSLLHAQGLFELCGKWLPKQRHELGGAAGAPLKIVIETVDDRPHPQPQP